MRIAINGFGRIGRTLLRLSLDTPDLEIVAINDLADWEVLAHLLTYDTVAGKLSEPVALAQDSLHVGDKTIKVTRESTPESCAWGDSDVDVVIDSTGRYTHAQKARKHLAAGAKKVVVSAPTKEADATIVYGVNHKDLKPEDRVISAASCTTNCLAPVASVLNNTFGISKGSMTTVHAYTQDQRLLDAPHKDFRRARSAAVNMVPTSTGAAAAIGLVIPQLAGRLDGRAIRVPIPDGSMIDLSVSLEKSATIDDLKEAFIRAENGDLKDSLLTTNEPVVSSDILGCTAGSLVDLSLCKSIQGDFASVVSWYDNETSYSSQLLRVVRHAGEIG